ncbi:MAG: hypothetical protein J3R72DRAFT_452269 [Linnemannia gamsii]|nr:MAG: hypothetical protein J3R72DRAFT_452269 [Linnemannia gamsii]
MSKRGTDNQLTRDNYDQEDQDPGSQMGTFKMAPSDELARRPMKALRRLGSKTLSNVSDDGKRPSPTASQSSTPNLPSSSPSPQPTTPSTNPFANVTFGATSAKTARFSTMEASPAGPQPISNSTGKPATRQMGRLARTAITTTATFTRSSTAPVVSLSSSILARGAFTFNIGSNANTLAITTPTPAPVEPLTIDREGYERSLRGVNQGFLKRIQRDLEHNASANLAGAFEAYIEHRKKVKTQYPGIEEPQTIVLPPSSGTDTGDITPVKKTFSGLGVNAVSGDTTSASSGSISAPPTSSPFVNLSLFGFGSSSIKGAIDPPRNPTSSAAWNNNNSGINGSTTLSSASSVSSSHFNSAFSASAAGATGSSMMNNTNTSFAPLSSLSSSNAFSNTSSSTSNKPFSFSPKPFTFSRQGSLSSGTSSVMPGFGSSATGASPKPFLFSTPSTDSQWTPSITNNNTASSSNGSSNDQSARDDQSERVVVVDDVRSELVDSRKGEEDEGTVYEVRAKLFGTENGEFQDLGVGQFRVNEHNVTKRRRMIMRTGGTGLITLNSWIIQGMAPQRNRTTLTIFAIENGKPRTFVLRVKEEQTAQDLLEVLEASQIAGSA